jgi:predicted ArsR family transcriptional regulator
MFPSADEALLSRLLGFLDKNDSGKLVTAFFEELWTERMTELLDTLGVPSLEAASLDERLVALEACLADKDFMPVIDRRPCVDGSQLVTIRECNCPYPAAARASRSPCEREIEFLVSALGARPRSLSIASSRKETCTFEFVVGPPDPSSEHQGA